MEWRAKWIKAAMGAEAPVFRKQFELTEIPVKAELYITALGVYEAILNGKRVGEFVLAPGWTSYEKRLQYQNYDVTELLLKENCLEVTVAKGWYHSPMPGFADSKVQKRLADRPIGLLAELKLIYEDGHSEWISTDSDWKGAESAVRFSEIYDGEFYDAEWKPKYREAVVFDGPYETLVPQEGEEIREQERIEAADLFRTPAGEYVIDFGQEVTGYVEIRVNAHSGEYITLSHAEVLDQKGNFYTENYRSAKALYQYKCKEGEQSCHAGFTFFGFRYVRIDAFPGGCEKARKEQFTAVVVHSEMRRTGRLRCSDSDLNRLFENIVWGQKGNFLDVPTDCPQRDERLGWTGDAQVFIKTACYFFDTEKFFKKWLADLAADQGEDGYVGHVIPDLLQIRPASTAWGDAAVICPWELYLAYGSREILERQFASMKKWVDYITGQTKTEYLWTGGKHYGDWLGLDAPVGSYKGSSREDLIASAFYAHSTELLIKAGKILNYDMSEYDLLYQKIIQAFRSAFPEYLTQTECVLAVQFRLAENLQKTADQLAEMVRAAGIQLKTGFVGTPYLLHVLSDYGYTDLAYQLLLRREYPSWLYPVTKDATTIWEHWDGIMESGDFWSSDMNSYNHYAYGAVADWVYSKAAGIMPVADAAGYLKVRIAPHPDENLDWLEASLETRHGMVSSGWRKQGNYWRYDISVPVEAELEINGTKKELKPGEYVFFCKREG